MGNLWSPTPQVYWSRWCYQQLSRQQFRPQPQPPALTTVRLPVASTAVTAKPLSALITTTAASFDRSYSHNYQLRLQPSSQQLQPKPSHQHQPESLLANSIIATTTAKGFDHIKFPQYLLSLLGQSRIQLVSRGFQPTLLIVSSFHGQPLTSSVFIWHFPLLIIILSSLHHMSPVSLPEIKRLNLPAVLLIAHCAKGFPNIQQDCHSLVLSSLTSIYQYKKKSKFLQDLFWLFVQSRIH